MFIRQSGKTCALNKMVEKFGIGFLVTVELNKEIRNLLNLRIFSNNYITNILNQVFMNTIVS